MALRIEKVYKNQEYRPRQRMCSCCSNLIPSFAQESENAKGLHSIEKRWYDNKYSGPILFTLAIFGAAMLSECTNSRQYIQKSKIETKVSDR